MKGGNEKEERRKKGRKRGKGGRGGEGGGGEMGEGKEGKKRWKVMGEELTLSIVLSLTGAKQTSLNEGEGTAEAITVLGCGHSQVGKS